MLKGRAGLRKEREAGERESKGVGIEGSGEGEEEEAEAAIPGTYRLAMNS